jgi:hypothetical protein
LPGKTSHPERFRFYILANNISLKNREKVTNTIQKYSASCLFIDPDTRAYRDIPKVGYSITALFRSPMGALLPKDVSKVQAASYARKDKGITLISL